MDAVIATVLLIAITIALIAAVYLFVVPWLQDIMGESKSCFDARIDIKDICLETARPYKFAVASDGHYNGSISESNWTNLASWIDQTQNLDRLFLNGDLTDADGIYPEYFSWVKDFLDNNISTPYSVVRGNHDGPEKNFAQVFNLTDNNYSFDEKGYHFIILNVLPGQCVPNLNWLEQDLNQNINKPTFIFSHIDQVNFSSYQGIVYPGSFYGFNCIPFQQIIKNHTNVIGVFYGHEHTARTCVFANETDQCYTGGFGSWWPPILEYKKGYRIVEIFPNGTIYTAYKNSTNIFNEGNFQSNRINQFSTVKIRLSRGQGNFNLSKVVVALNNQSGTFVKEIELTLNAYEEKEIFVRGININNVKIAPIIMDGNKKHTCDFAQEIIVKPCS